VHFVQSDGAGHDSDPVSSQAFTTALSAQVPAAFGAADWAIADAGTGGDARLSIIALPFAGAAALNGIEWRIGAGAWRQLGAVEIGTYALNDAFTDGVPTDVTLRAVNIIGPGTGSDIKQVTTSAASIGTITIGMAGYTGGGGGMGPVLDIAGLELTGTTGPYSLHLATHPAGTTLSKAHIEAGTGSALDALSLSDDDGAVNGQTLTLSQSLSGGHLSLFIRDSPGRGKRCDPHRRCGCGCRRADSVRHQRSRDRPDLCQLGGLHRRDWRHDPCPRTSVGRSAMDRGRDRHGPDDSVAATASPALYGGPTEPGLIALWDAHDMPDGPVATLSDLAGPFDLTAISAPTASGGVITFDGVDDVSAWGADFPDDTGAQIPGARHVRDYTLPDASGGDAGQGFSIAGFAYDDADGTWWAVNGGLNYDGSSSDRQQSLVHLSSDFSTNLGEIDLDAVLPDLDTERRKPAGRRGGQCERLSLGRFADSARVIHCFDKATGARLPANDITRAMISARSPLPKAGMRSGSCPGRRAMPRSRRSAPTAPPPSASISPSISTTRHDHLTEKDGLLYVSCGTNGAQAFVVAVDPVQQTVLAAPCCPIRAAPWAGRDRRDPVRAERVGLHRP
jgi:hypothetical protein